MNKNKMNELTQKNRFSQAQHSTNQVPNQDKETDVLAEAIMDNICNTPLGKLLGIIASLPEIRAEKVEHGQKLIHRKESDLDEQLDVALDLVLDELLSEK